MLLKAQNIVKYYGSKTHLIKVLDNINFSADKGEFIAVMGASGSGKTTLLNCLSTVDNVSAGQIFIGGEDITRLKKKDIARFRRENIGFIFQEYNLLDVLTIEENISLPLTVQEVSPTEICNKVLKVAEGLGIKDILSKFPPEVSGGEAQRCACARAVISEPQIIFADEPTGALDSKSSITLLNLMSKLNSELSSTIFMVTHDPMAASYAKRVLFIKDGNIFNEIYRGNKTQSTLHHEVLDVLSLLGGDTNAV